MEYQTLVDFLNENGNNAFFIKPENGDTFVKGQAIYINGDQFLVSDIEKTPYWQDYLRYVNRLNKR
ncbi:hypothetical protein J8Y17_28000 (plasmid) [Bacillus cereus]|uniref:hypothetical protein n=1 Tax=Bacillus cereus TaxID=1396 RepID=UPI001B8C5832|nr:hypothetical protein [Bacillus cereus]QUW34618.1 hypothetical protein J8Y17_28000 [Bacillus cereus]